MPIFAWNVPLISLIFLKRSLAFPNLLFSSISLHWSLRKAFLTLLAILWNSPFKWEYLSFSPLPFTSLLFIALCNTSSDNHAILQEKGIPDHLTCLLRYLDVGQEATVRTGHGTTDWFQIRKGVCQGCILPPCLFNLYTEYILRNAGLDESQAGIKITVISITSDMWMTLPLWQKAKN